jgi:hypothetical protein
MPILLALILTFATVTINHALAIATIGGNSNNMTRYIDPEGRFSIDYPTIWTGVHVTNRFQDMLESGQPPYTALIIDMLPTNVSDPAVIANTYKTGFSIPQNVECVKYQVEGQKACSYLIKITRPNGGTNLEGEQIFSHVNDKMFMFTMVAEQGNFSSYLPIFQSILTSFRSPPDTSRPLPQPAPFNPAVCPPGTVQSSTNQCTPINPGMLLPYFNSMTCPSGTVQTGPGECTQKSNLVPPGTLLPQPYQQSPSYRQPYYNTMICPQGTVQTGPGECTPMNPGILLPYFNSVNCPQGTVQTGPTQCTSIYNIPQNISPGTLLQPNPPTILSRSMYTDRLTGSTHVVGEVLNQSPITVQSVKVIATFYNAYNQVIGTGFAYTQPSDLTPGQRAPFHIIVLSGTVPMNQMRNYALSVSTS